MLTLKHVKMLKIPIKCALPIKQHIFKTVLLHHWVELNNPINNGIATFFCLAYYQTAFLSITNRSLVYMYRKCDPSLCYVSPQHGVPTGSFVFFYVKG